MTDKEIGRTPPSKEAVERSRERASEVKRAWDGFRDKGPEGDHYFSSGDSGVVFSDIQEGGDENGSWVDIWTGGPNPAFRICNPPTLVEDPEGEVEFEEPVQGGIVRKVRFRKDPLQAVASVIAELRGRK